MTTYKKLSLLILSLVLVSFLAPAGMGATTTSSSSPADLMQSLDQAMDTEKVEHVRIRFDLGMSRRISRSPSGFADLELAPGQVLNRDLLTVYAQKLALIESIDEFSIGEDSVDITIRGDARLLRLIPIGLPYKISVTLDGRTPDITVEHPSGWSWLAMKLSPDTVATRITNDMEEVQYISGTQQKAFLMEAIISSVNF